MIKKVRNELSQNKKYLYMGVLVSFLTVLPQLIMMITIKHTLSIILLFGLLVLISKSSKIIFSAFVIYINLINIFQSHVAIHWGGYTGNLTPRIAVSIQSPFYETIEYLNTYIDYRDYLVVIYSLFVLYLLFKFISHYKHTYKIVKNISIIISIILLTILQNSEPLMVIKEYIKANQISQIIIQRNEYLSKIKHTNKKDNTSKIYDKIIIIQGESANKHHLGIYGYDVKTTPFLTSLLKSNKLHIFNAIAATNQTRYAVSMVFTEAHVMDWEGGYIHSQSIVSDFKDYGYKTYWISNQGKTGENEGFVNNIASEANTQIFFNQGYWSSAKPDTVVNDYLNNKQANTNKEMYAIHLVGSHVAYKQRYAKECVLYKNPKTIIEEYDNTIHLTDCVIKNVIKYFEQNNQKILVVYVSDHGEVVNTKLHGHGFSETYKDSFEVPLIIYSNIQNERIKKLSNENTKHYFNIENLNYLIKYISGISDDINISSSSKVFNLYPKNVLDYNTLKFYK